MKKIIISISIIILVDIIVISITDIDITKAATTTLADTIISLSQGTSWNEGASGVYQTNDSEYRYVGAEPNNYVKFNNDMYQIIGVFDDNSHGVTGEYLVKLIRARSIGSFSWGVTNIADAYTTYSTYNNNWEIANANILLNEYFLNNTKTSLTYKSCSDWTYYYNDNNYKTKNCSKIISYGIKTSNLRNYIQPVTWYLKGMANDSYTKIVFYRCERSDTTTMTNCSSGNSGASATKVENKKIGLMYVSDYMYASGNFASSDTTQASNSNFYKKNWLYNGTEWTITPTGNSSYTFLIYDSISYTASYFGKALRPTFYLKSDVYVTGGNGSFSNPYTIACDTCNS